MDCLGLDHVVEVVDKSPEVFFDGTDEHLFSRFLQGDLLVLARGKCSRCRGARMSRSKGSVHFPLQRGLLGQGSLTIIGVGEHIFDHLFGSKPRDVSVLRHFQPFWHVFPSHPNLGGRFELDPPVLGLFPSRGAVATAPRVDADPADLGHEFGRHLFGRRGEVEHVSLKILLG